MLLNDLLYRCRALFRRDAVERELDEEIAFHTEQLVEKLMRAGMPREAASRQATLTLGGLDQQKELCRDARGTRLIEETWQDIRYALRTLRASPVFAATAVLTLALGTGANLVTFSGLNTILFRKLPVARPDELVEVTNQTHPPLPAFSYPDYQDFRDRNQVFSTLMAYRFFPMSLNRDGRNQRLWGFVVTGNYFELLGEKALIGRALLPSDDQQDGANPVAVISYGCWQRRFGADPGIIGRQATISGHPYTIVGVTRPQFFGTEFFFAPEVWVPLAMVGQIEPAAGKWRENRGATFVWVMGRLNPGVTSASAQSALRGIAAQLGREYPDQSSGMKLSVGPPGMIGGSIRAAAAELAALLIGITGLVLLVACTNLASLLLARAAARRKEIALRLALGAGRARLVRQLFAESALLSVAGCAVGFLLAHWIVGMLSARRPAVDMQVRANFEIDALGWWFTAGLAVATSLLFGLAPALSASRADVAPTLKGDSGISGRRRRWPARDLLITAQVAISMLLLVGAGLVTGSIQKALHVNLGFDPSQTTVAAFDLHLDGYDEARGHEFERRLLETLRSQPGVDSAAITSMIPLDLKWIIGNIYFDGAGPLRESDTPKALFYQVTTGYFQTLRTRLLAGRDFDNRDRSGARRVAVVNEAFTHNMPGHRKDVSSAVAAAFACQQTANGLRWLA